MKQKYRVSNGMRNWNVGGHHGKSWKRESRFTGTGRGGWNNDVALKVMKVCYVHGEVAKRDCDRNIREAGHKAGSLKGQTGWWNEKHGPEETSSSEDIEV